VADAKNTRLLPAVPVVDNVPLIVWRESKVRVATPAEAGAVTARLLNVFAPDIARLPAAVEVNETLLKVNPGDAAIPDGPLLPVIRIVEVPALKVRLVCDKAAIPVKVDVAVTVLAFKFNVLTLLPLRVNKTTVSA
jgi:hypothetical protein